jgi:hypothetical protein
LIFFKPARRRAAQVRPIALGLPASFEGQT